MKDYAIALALKAPKEQRKNILREYVQAQILFSMQKAGAFQHIAFQGGTALRFLYSLRRYSGDLDFSLEKKEGFRFEKIKNELVKDIQNSGFNVAIYKEKPKIVSVLSVRISEIMYEAGLSLRENENLNINIDVDTRPSLGAQIMTTLINKHFVISLRHHDLSSLMAGKCSAVFTRPYMKGRDLYDLLWYLTKSPKITPNLKFLNNALNQTGWTGEFLTEKNWKENLFWKIKTFNWEDVLRDVMPFLEMSSEATLLKLDTFKALLA